MKLYYRLFLLFAAVAVTQVGAGAQRSDPKQSRSTVLIAYGNVLPGMRFLRRADVRTELKLTGADATKTVSLVSAALTPIKTAKDRAKATAALSSLTALLGKSRKDRLNQLHLQAQGTFALSNDKIAAKVGLSQVQRQKIKNVRLEGLKKFDAEKKREGKAYKPDPATTKGIMDSMEGVLTPSQKGTWRSILGKPFKWSPPLRPF